MRALLTAVIYFGSFLAIGLVAKMALRSGHHQLLPRTRRASSLT
jgi:hypothetical protein